MKLFRDTNYLVHPSGRIVSSKTGKTIRPQNNGNGYMKVTLTIEGEQLQYYVHRMVGELYCEARLGCDQINHKNGNKADNHYQNLEWVTASENQRHAHDIGLKANGNQLWNGKFTKDDIDEMKAMDESGFLRSEIAHFFGCSRPTISDILNGKRYKRLTSEELELKQKAK